MTNKIKKFLYILEHLIPDGHDEIPTFACYSIPDNLPQLGVESAEASSDQQKHDQPENRDQILNLIFWIKLERDIFIFKIMKF